MIYNKGDIVIVPVPFTNNKGRKLRPAIVISDERVHVTNDVMIVQVTSKHKNDGLSMSITDADVSVQLPAQSYIRFHKNLFWKHTSFKGKSQHSVNQSIAN